MHEEPQDDSQSPFTIEEAGAEPADAGETQSLLLALAAREVRIGGVAAALWGLVLVVSCGLRFLGVLSSSFLYWDLAAGYALLFCSVGATVRNRAAMAIASVLAAVDLPVQVLAIWETVEQGFSNDYIAAVSRIGLLPIVLYLIVRGYRGSVDCHLLRGGQPLTNWRRWSPITFGVVSSIYVSLVVFGLVSWRASMRSAFEEPGAKIAKEDKTLKAISSELGSIDVKPFRTDDGDTAKLPQIAGKRDSDAAVLQPEDFEMLPTPVRQTAREATVFGAATDQVTCLTEALRRHEDCNDDDCRLLSRVFLTTCLSTSRLSKDFCVTVPSPAAVVETTVWRTRMCDKGRQLPSQCYAFFRTLQKFCHPQVAIERQDQALSRALSRLMSSLDAAPLTADARSLHQQAADKEAGGDPAKGRGDRRSPGGTGSAAPESAAAHGGEAMLQKPVREALEQAGAFATQTDNAGCLGEALRRHDSCTTNDCRALSAVFLATCLNASRSSKDFCVRVPSPISVVETTAWQSRVCDSKGREPAPCRAFFGNLQDFCHPEAAKASLPAAPVYRQ